MKVHDNTPRFLSMILEVIVDGITIFLAFLIRDTLLAILNEIDPERETKIYSNIMYTCISLILGVVLIYIIRRYMKTLHYSSRRSDTVPVSFSLFD